MRKTHLLFRILVSAKAGARDGDILFITGANLSTLFGEREQFLRGLDHVFSNLQLQPGLAGAEPALGHRRCQRLPSELEISLCRCVRFLVSIAAVAHAAPQVRLPRNTEREELQGIAAA